MQKIAISFFIFLFIATSSLAQTSRDKKQVIFTGSIIVSHYLGGEAGVLYAEPPSFGPCGSGLMAGPRFSAECYFPPNGIMVAPKIGYEFDLVVFGARGSIADYTDFHKHDVRFTPEIGVTALGGMDIFYGYNIPLTTNRLPQTPGHRLTISLNMF